MPCESFKEEGECHKHDCGALPQSMEACSPEDFDWGATPIWSSQIISMFAFAIIFILIFIGTCYNGRENHYLYLNQIASFTAILITISMIWITYKKANSFEPRPFKTLL